MADESNNTPNNKPENTQKDDEQNPQPNQDVSVVKRKHWRNAAPGVLSTAILLLGLGGVVGYNSYVGNKLKSKIETTFSQDFRTLYGEKKIDALLDAQELLREVNKRTGIDTTKYQATLDSLLQPIEDDVIAKWMIAANNNSNPYDVLNACDYAITNGFDEYIARENNSNTSFSEMRQILNSDSEQKLRTQLDAKEWYGASQTINLLAAIWGKGKPRYDEFVQSRRDLREAAQYWEDYKDNKNWSERKELAKGNIRNAVRHGRKAEKLEESLDQNLSEQEFEDEIFRFIQLNNDVLNTYESEEDKLDFADLENKLTEVYTGLDADLFGNKLNLDEEAGKMLRYLVDERDGRTFSFEDSKKIADLLAKLISERASQTSPTTKQRYIKTMHNTFGLPFKAGYHVGKAVKGLLGALISPFSSDVEAKEELEDAAEGLVGTVKTATDLVGTAKTPLSVLGKTSVYGVQVGKPLEVIDENTPFQSPWSDRNFYDDTHTGYFPVPWKLLDSDVRKQLYEQQGNWVYLGVPVQLVTDYTIINSLVKHYEGGKETGGAGNNNSGQPQPNPEPTPSPTPSPVPTPTPTPTPTPGGIGGNLGNWSNGVNSK